ncbi:hypothetical protein PCORN_02998 [Listeria cornellensis FSL F6-0969]|uniref:Uncharacterized protein n=1 Tax=Listeria cornellensis FSL F6-0969 TaxID=1265820 RepID=W7C8W7_9LIST|nr:hypothetical protein PCORN_02998 [Listeria cornellensis FSL F6-0969]
MFANRVYRLRIQLREPDPRKFRALQKNQGRIFPAAPNNFFSDLTGSLSISSDPASTARSSKFTQPPKKSRADFSCACSKFFSDLTGRFSFVVVLRKGIVFP